MTHARRHAFTLIELLVVVAILGILAGIAVPNLLLAQTRAKVSAARANLRVLGGGLQAYYVDNNAYPPTDPQFPDDPLALLADAQLSRVTTPIAYVSSSAFKDPFGTARLYSLFAEAKSPGLDLFPPNENQVLLYYHYRSTSDRLFGTPLSLTGCALVSIGPDLEDSLGAFSRLPENEFQVTFVYSPIREPADTIYDPTNGVVSSGDIVLIDGSYFAGEN